FLYTNTISSIVAARGRSIPSRSLCYSARAPWGQIASVAWNAVLWYAKANNDVARLSLHPQDLQVSRFHIHISAIISGAIDLGFRPTTYRDVVSAETAQNV